METVIKVGHLNLTSLLVVLMVAPFLSMCSTDDTEGDGGANSLGEISGTVSSTDGDTYSEISVELVQNGQNLVASDVTDASGNYQITKIKAGNYSLLARAPLGARLSSNNRALSISEGQKIVENFSFEIRSVNAVVAVDPNDPIGEVINENGEVPTGNAPLYTPFSVLNPGAGVPTPVKAPDGSHVTLNEWKAARGTAQISCSNGVTNYQLEFSGLIPNGVYTLWNLILKKPQRPTDKLSFANDFLGMGALKDGESNILIASAEGDAEAELSVDAGALSMFGTTPACAITETDGFVIVLDYHINQQTYGGTPGPDHQDIGHLLFFY